MAQKFKRICQNDGVGDNGMNIRKYRAATNPLAVDLILENIFKYCDYRTLNQCRLVNPQWYKISLPKWLQVCPVKYLCEDPKSKHYVITKTTVKMFLDEVHNQSHSSYEFAGVKKLRKFQIWYSKLASDYQVMSQFWKYCGNWITHLDFPKVDFMDLQAFKDLLSSKYTPKLKKLHLSLVHFDFKPLGAQEIVENIEDDIKPNENLLILKIDFLPSTDRVGIVLPVCWKWVFLHCPNLEHLSVGRFGKTWKDEFGRIFSAITTIRKVNSNKLNLKKLNISKIFDIEIAKGLPPLSPQCFQDSHIHLSHLKINVGQENDSNIIRKLLETQAETLQHLTIYRNRIEQGLQLPLLEKLKTLTCFGLVILDLANLRNCPSLETLQLKEEYRSGDSSKMLTLNGSDFTDINNVVLPSLTKFECDYGIERGTDIQKLHQVMPNIINLTLRLTNEAFRQVCACWPNLVKLKTIGEAVDDEGITGIVGEDTDVTFEQNITNLQKLQEFCMKGISTGLTVTDKSVHHGFLLLPQLQILCIIANNISSSAVIALEEKIPSATVFTVRNVSQVSVQRT